MAVLDTKDIDFDPTWLNRLSQNLDRIKKKRYGLIRFKADIATTGTMIRHNLGTYPMNITIVPLSDFYVWHHHEPDSINLHLTSSDNGTVLITVSGE